MSHTHARAALAVAAVLLLPAATASAAVYGDSFLYASNFDDAEVQRLSVTPDGTLGVSTSYAAGLQTTALIIAPDAGALFAGSIGGARIDSYAVGADGALGSSAFTPAAHSVDLAMTPDGAFLFGVKSDSGASSTGTFGGFAVSGSTLTPLADTHTLPSSHIASAIAISPDGDSLYVAASDTYNGSSGFIYRYGIDGATGSLSGPTLVADGFTASVPNLALTPDGRSLYAPSPNAGSVYQFDVTPSTGALSPKATAAVTTGSAPYSMTVTPNGKFAYANGQFDVTGFAIDPVTGSLSSVGSPMSTNFLGRFGAVSPDSKNLYVTAYPVHHFAIDPATGVLTPRGSGVGGSRFHVGLAFTPDQGPVASFEATSAPVGSPSTFDASASSDSDGTIATYSWDFGDGPPVSGGPTISHTFTTPGPHAVDLTVTDDMGCSTSRTYTGHMVHCNGSGAARRTTTIVVDAVTPVGDPTPPPVDPAPTVAGVPAPTWAPAAPGPVVTMFADGQATNVRFGAATGSRSTVTMTGRRRGRARVEVTNANDFPLTARLRFRPARVGGHAPTAPARRLARALGRPRFAVPAQASSTVRLRLGPAGRRNLRRARSVKVIATLKVRDPSRNLRTVRRGLAIRAPR